jgi:hypothetical protein
MGEKTGKFGALRRVLQRIFPARIAESNPPAAPRAPQVEVLDVHARNVVIEDYNGVDPHDRWFHVLH